MISSHTLVVRYSFLDLCVWFFSVHLSVFCDSSFFVGYILQFPLFPLLSILCVIHGFLAFLSTFPVTSLIVSSTHFLIFHRASRILTFTFFYTRFSRVSFAFCHLAYNISRSHLGFCLELYDVLQSNANLHNHIVVVSIIVCFRHCLCMLHIVSELMLTRT